MGKKAKGNLMIPRAVSGRIRERFFEGKAIILLGPRQSGKTTLINSLLQEFPGQFKTFNGDEPDVRDLFREASSTRLKSLAGEARIIFIDEAQRIPEIGLCIKLLVDNYPDLQVVASGSSAFELGGLLREALTGRKYEFFLYPLSYGEMASLSGHMEEDRLIPHRLVYGYYPELVVKQGREEELLRLLADSYMFKDLFNLEQIKKPPLLEKIVRALALQVGQEVSFSELARLVGADNQTVEKYVDLMEKAFIVHRLPALKRNLRNEIKRGVKFYFWDNGLLNATIGNFNAVSSRSDVGPLWENFAVSERKKYLANQAIYTRSYFWRTTQQQEIDYIEEHNSRFSAYELKWNPARKVTFSRPFIENYPIHETGTINPKTLWNWIS